MTIVSDSHILSEQTLCEHVFSHKDLSFEQTAYLFDRIIKGDMSEITLSALLIGLKMKPEAVSEIAGAASAMRANAQAFPRPDYAFSDIVGTGGDGHNTINISSAAAVVAASCGVKVAKHGNRSVSSKSGSSDLFAAFGVKLDMTPQTARRCLDEANICFLAAPQYHSGIKHAMPVRTALKTRTIFNILGPLANPANPSHNMLGVYSPELMPQYIDALTQLGVENAYVVHGAGLDELALHGESSMLALDNGELSSHVLSPSDFGFTTMPLSALVGGAPEQNKEAIEAVFNGVGSEAHTAAIAMNAAALIRLNKLAPDFKQASDMAMASIEQGQAMTTITQMSAISRGEA